MNFQEKTSREKAANENADYDVFAEGTSPANHNISSVLSQIQDDGPAYSDSVAQSNRVDFRSNDSDNKDSHQSSVVESAGVSGQDDEQIQDEVHLDFSAALKQKQAHKPEQAKPTMTKKTGRTGIFSGKNSPLLPFYIIAAIVVLVIITTLYRLDVRTDKLEQSLILHDESVLESIDYQTAKISPIMSNLKKTLNSVRDEVELLKADSDKKEMSQTEEQTSQAYENIKSLKDEVVALRNELQTVTGKLNISNKNDQSKDHKVVQDKADKPISIVGSWVVNIASFAEKAKALKVLTRLSSFGYPSTIEEVVVNEVNIYRIVVGGFTDRAKAEMFVRKATSEYGMKDGWIRKS